MADEPRVSIWKVTYTAGGYQRWYRFIAAASEAEAARRAREEFDADQILAVRYHEAAAAYADPAALAKLESLTFLAFWPTERTVWRLLASDNLATIALWLVIAAVVVGFTGLGGSEAEGIIGAIFAAALLITGGVVLVASALERLRQAVEGRDQQPPPPPEPPDES